MKKTHVVLVIALLFAVVLFLGIALTEVSAATPATLTVTVLDGADYQPVAGAKVSISGPQSLSKTTGSDGRVVFYNIQTGTYLVTSVAAAYPMTTPQSVQVRGNTSMTMLYGHTRAFFTYKPNPAIVNETIYFDAALSYSTGAITGYSWDFGDNSYATNLTTSHTYNQTGQYRVSLTVTSTVGAAIYTQTLTIPQQRPINSVVFLIIIPILIPIILLFIWMRRRRYYVVIQARVPPNRRHPLCPGTGDCDNCKLTPC